MTTQLSTTQKRDMDALLYLRNVDQWQKKVTLKDGRRAYGIPSRTRPGLFHLTDGSDCTCEDHLRNGARCAHMIAAALYRMERAAMEAALDLATDAELDAYQATSAPQFRREEARREALVSNSRFFESVPTHGARCHTDLDAQAALDEIMRKGRAVLAAMGE